MLELIRDLKINQIFQLQNNLTISGIAYNI
jgi:hypothetical protein